MPPLLTTNSHHTEGRGERWSMNMTFYELANANCQFTWLTVFLFCLTCKPNIQTYSRKYNTHTLARSLIEHKPKLICYMNEIKSIRGIRTPEYEYDMNSKHKCSASQTMRLFFKVQVECKIRANSKNYEENLNQNSHPNRIPASNLWRKKGDWVRSMAQRFLMRIILLK